MDKQQILQLIKNRRKYLSINQKEMADNLEIAQTQYSKYEVGKSEIALNKLLKIMELLDIEMNLQIKSDNTSINKETTDELMKYLLECVELIKNIK